MANEDFLQEKFGTAESLPPIKLVPETTNPIGFRHSATIGKLTEALAKASLKFGPIKKETENPYFKSQYADLSTLIEATRDALSGSGLVVIQTVRTGDGTVSVTTALLHTSNEWISDDLVLRPAKFDAQGCGAASTYARRYSYQSILNIAGEVDDDGNAASGKTAKKGVDIGEAEEQFQERTGAQRAGSKLVDAAKEVFKNSGKTEKQLADYLRSRFSAEKPDQLTSQEVSELVKWLSGQEPLEETLKTSVVAAAKAVDTFMQAERPNTPPKSSQGLVGRVGVSEKQIGRLWAIAKAHAVSQEDVHQFIKEYCGAESVKDLDRASYDETCRFLEAQ